MRKLSLNEIKEIELDILIDVTDFCERNGIDYFISCGTLLGAVRHKGFIPWDDDIDITMPRDSYEKFLSIYRSDKNYKAVSAYTCIRYSRRFARVVSTDTCHSVRRTIANETGVCIDVFPLDFFGSEQQAKDIYQYLFPLQNNNINKTSLISKAKKFVKDTPIGPLLLQIRESHRTRIKDRYVRASSGQKNCFASALLAPTNKIPEIFRYSDVFPTKLDGMFEGHLFRTPNDTDCYLTLLYGDYMSLPPIEKRRPAHYTEAYLKD